MTVSVSAIASIAVVIFIYWYVKHSPTEFERSVWLQGETASDHPRLRMADGLLSSEVLLGKSKDQIEAMLGVPHDGYMSGAPSLIYWLGPERGFISIDSEWMTIEFDQSGKVNRTRIVTD